MQRRHLLKQGFAIAAMSTGILTPSAAFAAADVKRRSGTRLKLCLNAFSFNHELLTGQMTLDDVIDFCAEHEVDGVDMTGYYFGGYPDAPSDEVIYNLKRNAFLNGVTISGTGVRNDFAVADSASRDRDIELVKNWIEVAEKLGADVVRVFSGKRVPDGFTFEQALEWVIPAFKACADYGKQHGVIVGLQQHHDFLKTAAQTIQVIEAVDSPWFNVILDVGSLRQNNVYDEVEKLLPHTCTWQVKEQVWIGDQAVPIDLSRLKMVIEKTGYRGFLPIEVTGSDPTAKERIARVSNFISRVKQTIFAS
jgi:sugar phosphate isomerase/epimerase